ncbi:MAG: hypothetical protein OXI63_07245 [Candidatus Poribacteria bacterium]|nr:hypothetical protein [Candidatus Poribacteria bacterium]
MPKLATSTPSAEEPQDPSGADVPAAFHIASQAARTALSVKPNQAKRESDELVTSQDSEPEAVALISDCFSAGLTSICIGTTVSSRTHTS